MITSYFLLTGGSTNFRFTQFCSVCALRPRKLKHLPEHKPVCRKNEFKNPPLHCLYSVQPLFPGKNLYHSNIASSTDSNCPESHLIPFPPLFIGFYYTTQSYDCQTFSSDFYKLFISVSEGTPPSASASPLFDFRDIIVPGGVYIIVSMILSGRSVYGSKRFDDAVFRMVSPIRNVMEQNRKEEAPNLAACGIQRCGFTPTIRKQRYKRRRLWSMTYTTS